MKGLQVTKKVRSYEKGTKKVRSNKKGTKLRKRHEVTKKVRSYEKGTKSRTWYEATKKVRRCYKISYVQRCDVMLTVTSSMNAVLHKAYK
jgi:hypothetical protein